MALWKDVPGYEGLYQVSDSGEVRSLSKLSYNGRGWGLRKQKLLKPGHREGNYLFVVLSNGKNVKHEAVHRLVAMAFLENPKGLPEVNHKDEDPQNNTVENLEWCSRQYNIDYSKSKKVSQFTKTLEKVAEYKSIANAAELTGISRRAINNNLCGWSKSAGGYIWKYETEG